MKKLISISLALIIVFSLLFMGVMEKTLSGVGGNKAIIVFYVILALILLVFYIRAKKESDAENKESEKNNKTDDIDE